MKNFREDVCSLFFRINTNNLQRSIRDMIPEIVTFNSNMFCRWRKTLCFYNRYTTFIVFVHFTINI